MNYGENVCLGNELWMQTTTANVAEREGGWEKLFDHNSACKTSRKEGIKLENMTSMG